jgi:HK97 gp10 family phage protein
MANLKTTGLNETIKMLEKIEDDTDYIIEEALKESGGVVCDVCRKEISSLRTSDQYEGGNGKRFAKPSDIKGLLDSLGYSPVQLNGTVFDIKCGWGGYNKNKTKKYPNGHANKMIANAINAGTSFQIAQPFINRTAKKSKEEAIQKIQEVFDKAIKNLTK